MGVLAVLTAVPPGDATVEQRTECSWHALRIFLKSRPHRLRGAEVRRVARVEQVGIERRAPELALFLERFAQIVGARFDVDRRDARFAFQHGRFLFAGLFPLGAAWPNSCGAR
jgi:hypothetical protein